MRFLSRLLLLILLALAGWRFGTARLSFFQADLSMPANLSQSAEWRDILNLSSNAFHSWRSDALLVKIESLWNTQGTAVSQAPWITGMALFFLGTLWLFTSLRREGGLVTAALNSGALTLVLLLVFGLDRVVFGSLTFLPWTILFLRRLLADKSDILPFSIVSLFFVLRLAAGANQLALLILCAALAVSLALARDIRNSRVKYFPWITVLVLLGAAAWPLFFAPTPSFPDYPAFARVVPFSNVAYFVRPLSGAESPIAMIDRTALRQNLSWISAVLFLLSALHALVYRGSSSRRNSRIALRAALLLSLTAALDTLPPESISQIMPLASLSRLLPGLFFIPLAAPITALAVFFFMAGLHAARNDLAIALITGVLLVTPPSQTGNYVHSDMNSGETIPPAVLRILVSPSSQILRDKGAWILEQREAIQSLKPRGIRRLVKEMAASPSGDRQALQQIFDGKPRTRWSPQKGRQEGGNTEWLAIRLETPLRAAGLEVSPGEFQTDFPRGLRIAVSPECTSLPFNEEGLTTVFSQLPWQGELKFTPSGFPYYGGQSEVKAYFREALQVQCLKIFQTGESPDFDWSVSRIRLLVPPQDESIAGEDE